MQYYDTVYGWMIPGNPSKRNHSGATSSKPAAESPEPTRRGRRRGAAKPKG
jgi:hypothetical protein